MMQIELGNEVREWVTNPHVNDQKVVTLVVGVVTVNVMRLQGIAFSPDALAKLTAPLAEISNSA